jgi:hypothetical protein
MPNMRTTIQQILHKIYWILLVLMVVVSCKQDEYTIEYSDGYPNSLAGNWRAFEFQGGAYDLDKLSDEYDLVSALDPNNKDSLVIDNLYNSGVRVRTSFEDSVFNITHGRQLEVINMGQYGINTVSIDGEFQHTTEDGDFLVMNVGLYDRYAAIVDTILVIAFRKDGFEDVDYKSLLNN